MIAASAENQPIRADSDRKSHHSPGPQPYRHATIGNIEWFSWLGWFLKRMECDDDATDRAEENAKQADNFYEPGRPSMVDSYRLIIQNVGGLFQGLTCGESTSRLVNSQRIKPSCPLPVSIQHPNNLSIPHLA